MSSEISRDTLAEIGRNDRYFLAILAAFVLGLLLLFYKDLHPWLQKQFVPTYIVYIIGAALIAQIQNMVGNREKLRNEAEGRPFVGSAPLAFWLVVVAHVCWFSAWVAFLLFHSAVIP